MGFIFDNVELVFVLVDCIYLLEDFLDNEKAPLFELLFTELLALTFPEAISFNLSISV